jgi:hypothetical protein
MLEQKIISVENAELQFNQQDAPVLTIAHPADTTNGRNFKQEH